MLSLNDKKKIKIGLVGIGTMGQIIAYKLLENKYQVIGYDLLPELRKNAYEIGVGIVNSVGDITKKAKVIFLLF